MKIKKLIGNTMKLLAVPALMLVLIKLLFPQNVTFETVQNMIYQAVAPAIIAWGACFNIEVGNRDFSIGAVALVAGILGGNIALSLGFGFAGIFVCTVIVGILCSCVTAGLYMLLRVPSVVISVGMVYMLESFSGVYKEGKGVMIDTSSIVLASFWPQVLVGFCMFLLSFYLYNYNPFGYHVRAIGAGMAVAEQKSINVRLTKALTFVVVGIFAGTYAAVTLGTSGVYRASVSSLSTMSIAFDAMMSVWIGRSLSSFANLSVCIFVGSVALRILKLTMILIGFPAQLFQIVVAVFVLMFMCISSYKDIKKSVELAKARVEA